MIGAILAPLCSRTAVKIDWADSSRMVRHSDFSFFTSSVRMRRPGLKRSANTTRRIAS
jgi:hypothetical protein